MFLYFTHGLPFVYGYVDYIQNNNSRSESENCWQIVIDEYKELVEAIHEKNPTEIFLEFFDVIMSAIKYFVVTRLPTQIYSNWLFWSVIFPFVAPGAIKLGSRYINHGCIRNHKRRNANHYCSINGYAKCRR